MFWALQVLKVRWWSILGHSKAVRSPDYVLGGMGHDWSQENGDWGQSGSLSFGKLLYC